MSYETHYRLTILDAAGAIVATKETPATMEIWAREIDNSDMPLRDMAGPRAGRWDWRAMNEDMARLARDYPNYVFQVDGKGENAGDVWRKWWHGEKTAEWQLDPTPPTFHPSRLSGDR